MAESKTSFQLFLEGEVNRYKGVYVPVKTAFLKRAFVRELPVKKLHPNPEDEFCDPQIGPNDEIVSRYQHEIWVAKKQRRIREIEEDLIVERIRPDGYILLNGHHRWAAAKRMGLRRVPVRIVNLTHSSDIKKMLKNAKHDKRVALDLDEVVFASGQDTAMEKALPFPANRVYKERLRYGVPALIRYFKTNGYDVWVYTAKYYSMEYIQHLFKWYGVRIDNIVTGTSRKGKADAEERKRLETLVTRKYPQMIHLDANSLVRIDRGTKSFEEFALSGNPRTWSQEIMEIVGGAEKHEG
ncbi:MAG: ParB N-terminal domain-containing protein [Clostridia bacterium]|nr:ParB N-terminal domain-containing protein [Clostridia bacterium]